MVFRAREIKVYRAAGAVQSSQVRSGQVRSVQSGQVRSGQVRSRLQ
jgi:hypothetical protein